MRRVRPRTQFAIGSPTPLLESASHEQCPIWISQAVEAAIRSGYGIPKSVKPDCIAENFDVFEFGLTRQRVDALDPLDTGVRGGPEPDDEIPVRLFRTQTQASSDVRTRLSPTAASSGRA